MDALTQLWGSLVQVFWAVWDLLATLGALVLPLLPLIAWVAFWLFAVNWTKLRRVLLDGGWVGAVLIGLVAVLAWGMIAPPAGGAHHMLGLSLSNFVGKTVYVTILFCIALLCGSVQLAGFYTPREEEPADEEHAPAVAHHGSGHH